MSDLPSREERCSVCGFKMVTVRGQYPGGPDRTFCPQCLLEQLEMIVQEVNTFAAVGVTDEEASK